MSTPNAAHYPANDTRVLVTERPRRRAVLTIAFLTVVAAISIAAGNTRFAIPAFTDVTVHDPSVVRAGAHFYVFGSHLASARTFDGLRWTQITSDTDSYSVADGPAGLTVDRKTGVLTWRPALSDVGIPHEVTIRARPRRSRCPRAAGNAVRRATGG